MPRISNLQKIKNEALAKLNTVQNLIDGRTVAAFQRKIYATNRKDTATKLFNQISEITTVKETIGETSNKKVTIKMMKTAKQIKSTPIKILYKFVVNVLQTKVFSPVAGEWINMRYFQYGKNSGQWSEQNIEDEKFAEEDKIDPSSNKIIWKKGEKLVLIFQGSVTVETNMLITDGDNKPFEMTSRGMEVGLYKNRKQSVLRYDGNKPYEYSNFYLDVNVIRDDYSITPRGDWKSTHVNLPIFLDKIFNNMIEKTQSGNLEYIVTEHLGIIKVNDGLESIGETSPIHMMMMKGVIMKDCWLRYAKDISSKAFEETDNICVYHQLAHFLLNPTSGKPTKFIDGNRVSEEALYKFLLKTFPDLKMDAGVSTFMVDLIGRETKRNVYAYDFNDQCFLRSVNNTDRNYCPIIFYRGNGHMYLIDTKEAFKSIVERNKVTEPSIVSASKNIEKTKKDKKEVTVHHVENFDGITCSLGQCDQLEKGVYLMNRYSICNDVIKFIEHYRIIPKVKTTKNVITSMSFLNTMNEEVTIACDVNYEKGGILYDHLKNVATENQIDYVNEGIGAVVSRIVCKHKKQKREYLDEQSRLNLIESFEHKCATCKLYSEVFEIDHITPLSSGGSNDVENLQPLCPDCHKQKTDAERENGEYDDNNSDMNEEQESSSFNSHVFNNVISTESFKTWQFVERTDATFSPDDVVKKLI